MEPTNEKVNIATPSKRRNLTSSGREWLTTVISNHLIGVWKVLVAILLILLGICFILLLNRKEKTNTTIIFQSGSGRIFAINLPNSLHVNTDEEYMKRLLWSFITFYIEKAKTISGNSAINQANLDDVYDWSSPSATAFLDEFYGKNNPLDLAQSLYSRSVEIDAIFTDSNRFINVTWRETDIPKHGTKNTIRKWMGQFKIQRRDFDPTHIDTFNPIEFFVETVDWRISN